jgi:hypothetical protein
MPVTTDHPERIANLLNVTPELLREFLAHCQSPTTRPLRSTPMAGG